MFIAYANSKGSDELTLQCSLTNIFPPKAELSTRKKYKRPLSSQDAVHARFKSFVANSLDPDQAQYFVGPDLDPDWLTLR